MVELAIDSSTSKCGLAVFEHGELTVYSTAEFPGTFDQLKLRKIIQYFEEFISDLNPDMVLIEEPLVFAKQSRSVAMLNQVGGAIYAVATMYKKPVVFFHGQKVKKYLSYKTKEESIKIAEKMNKCKGINEHEADAMNLYNAYTIFGNDLSLGTKLVKRPNFGDKYFSRGMGEDIIEFEVKRTKDKIEYLGKVFNEKNATKTTRKNRKAKPRRKQRD